MAEVQDVDQDLRALARRVPEDIRANLSPLELRLRCEEAASLLDRATSAADEAKASRFRTKAGRILAAVSPAGYDLAMRVLESELRDATQRGDDRRAWEIHAEIGRFEQRNPQPDPDRLMAAAVAAVSRDLKIPPPPPGNWFTRNRRNRRKLCLAVPPNQPPRSTGCRPETSFLATRPAFTGTAA